MRELWASLCVLADSSRFGVDIQLRDPRISVEVDPVGGWPTTTRTHSSNKTNAHNHWSPLLDARQGPLGTTRRQEDGHPSTRHLGGVDTVDRVVTGGPSCGVLPFSLGACLFLSPNLLAMREPGRVAGRILYSRQGCVAGNRLRRVYAGLSTVRPTRRVSRALIRWVDRGLI